MPSSSHRQLVTSALVAGAVAAAVSVGPAVAEQTARIASHISSGDIANNSVSGRDIRNNSVTGSDIRNASVGGIDVRTGSLTHSDIRNNTLGGDDVRQNSLGTTDILDNSLTGADVFDGGLGSADLLDGSVGGIDVTDGGLGSADVADNALTGNDIDEGSLGTVPSATSATSATNASNADNVAGRTRFHVRLAAGATQTVATSGPVSIVAECLENSGGNDVVRLLAATTEANSFLEGPTDLDGGPLPTDFLQPDTAADNRVLADEVLPTGTTPSTNNDTNDGFVVDGDGQNVLSVSGDTLVLGLNVGGTKCLAAGVVEAISG